MLKSNYSINQVFKFFVLFFIAFIAICFICSVSVKASTSTDYSNDPVINVTNNDCTRKSDWNYCFGPEKYREDHYSILLQIIDFERDLYDNGYKQWTEYTICFESATGNHYHYTTQDGDFSINDYFTAIVYDNGTCEVKDDKIISIKYERPDLFMYK